MKHRKIITILILLAIGGAAWLVPYDFAGHCTKLAAEDITMCFFRNAGVTVGRSVPLLLALIVMLGSFNSTKPKPPRAAR